MKRSLTCFDHSSIHVRSLFNEKLTKTWVSMEHGPIQIKIIAKGRNSLAVANKKFDCRNVTVVGTQLNQSNAFII